MSYFSKRKKQKLYQQWMDKSGLPPESVPADTGQESDFRDAADGVGGLRRPGMPGDVTLRLTMRHVLYLVLVAVALLITTVTLATVLIMRSC